MRMLDPAQRELVALGAAMGSNCVPCIEFHIPEARKVGLNDTQIREAILLADHVRQVPARKVLAVATALVGTEEESEATAGPAPACGQTEARGSPEPCCG